VTGRQSADLVVVYRRALYETNGARWPNLKALLETDPRLQFAD